MFNRRYGGVYSMVLGSRSSQEADQARAMEDHLGRMIEALEQDKLTGARTVSLL